MRFKNKKIFGLSLTFFLIGLMVVGGATAAIVTYFGTVSVDLGVTQALAVTGDTETTVGDSVAPNTFNSAVAVENNNDERAVSYKWVENEGGSTGTLQGVYEEQSYDLIGFSYGDSSSVETGNDVVVRPGIDEVTYIIDYPASATGANLQIARSDDGIVNVEPVGACQNPRYRLNIDYGAGTYEEVVNGLTDSMNCGFTTGMLDNSTCESIAGCDWVVMSYWFSSDETVCDGYIDGNEYDIDIRTNIFGMERVDGHNNTGIGARPSICNHPSVIHDQDLCETFLCTWDTDQERDD